MEEQWPMWSEQQKHHHPQMQCQQDPTKQPETAQSPMVKRVASQKAPWRSASPLSASTEMLFGVLDDSSNPGSRRSCSPLVACRDMDHLNDLSDAEAIRAVTGNSGVDPNPNTDSDVQADQTPNTSTGNSSNSSSSSPSALRKVPELPPRNYSLSQLRKDSGVSVVEPETHVAAPAAKLPPIPDETAQEAKGEAEDGDKGAEYQDEDHNHSRKDQQKQQQPRRQLTPPSHQPFIEAASSQPPSPSPLVGRRASVPQDLRFLQEGSSRQQQQQPQAPRERGRGPSRVWQLLLQPIQRLGRSRSRSPLQEGTSHGDGGCSHDSKGKRGNKRKKKPRKQRGSSDSSDRSGKTTPQAVSKADAKRGYAVPQDALLNSDPDGDDDDDDGDSKNERHHAMAEYALVAAEPSSVSRVSSCSPHMSATPPPPPPPPLTGTALPNRGPGIDNTAARRASQDDGRRAAPPRAQTRPRSNTTSAAVYCTPTAPTAGSDGIDTAIGVAPAPAAAATTDNKQEVEPCELFARIYNQIPSRQERRDSEESLGNSRQPTKGGWPMLRRKHRNKGDYRQPQPQRLPQALHHNLQVGKQHSAPLLRTEEQAVHVGQQVKLHASPGKQQQQQHEQRPRRGLEPSPEYDNGDLCADVCYAMAGSRVRQGTDSEEQSGHTGSSGSNFNGYQLVRATKTAEEVEDPTRSSNNNSARRGTHDSISEYFEAGLYKDGQKPSQKGKVCKRSDSDSEEADDEDHQGDAGAQRAEPIYSKVNKKRGQKPRLASSCSSMSVCSDGYAKIKP